jgi:DNA replication and repair protein RecF
MIASLRLQNFRSYLDDSFEFEPGVNIIVGPNACGKTNLLEGILVLSSGGSYRTPDHHLIAHGQPWARLDGDFDNEPRTLKLEHENGSAGFSKTFIVDDKTISRPKLDNLLPVVLFEPNHLQLLVRGPETRREYFDDLLEQTIPGHKTLKNHYRRALSQRNALLKQPKRTAEPQLFFWNIRLCELAGTLVEQRLRLIAEINEKISDSYSGICHKPSIVELLYDSSLPTEDYSSRLMAKLEQSTDKDFLRGFTAYGPHRDDIAVMLNGQLASHTASRGETRTLLLALKIFELELIERARGKKPILLLDDVFSELDGSRRQFLVHYLQDRQVIITTTDADAVVSYFAGHYNLLVTG